MSTRLLDSIWIDLCALDDIPPRGARRIAGAAGPIAVFRTGADEVFALADRCPHKGGPLSMGIVHGDSVTCPLHAQRIDLATGQLLGADTGKGCAATIAVRRIGDRIEIVAEALR
jgi:nitrite reductase (NADH) small subunit